MGEIAALSASAMWACASLLFSRLGKSVGPLVVNMLKCVIAVGLMVVVLVVLEGRMWPAGLSGFNTGMLAISGVAGLTLGDTAFLAALNRLGPRRTLLLAALTPPMTAAMARPVLGEPLTVELLVGMALTLGGVVWVILERHDRPEAATDAPHSAHSEPTPGLSGAEKVGVALGILSALGQALGNIFTKLGGAEISALEISIVRLTFGIVSLAVVLGAAGRLVELPEPFKDARTSAMLFVATFFGTFMGIWLMNAGLRYTYVGIASTLSSTSPIFVLPLAYYIDGERLTVRSVVGACVAVAGVAVLFLGG